MESLHTRQGYRVAAGAPRILPPFRSTHCLLWLVPWWTRMVEFNPPWQEGHTPCILLLFPRLIVGESTQLRRTQHLTMVTMLTRMTDSGCSRQCHSTMQLCHANHRGSSQSVRPPQLIPTRPEPTLQPSLTLRTPLSKVAPGLPGLVVAIPPISLLHFAIVLDSPPHSYTLSYTPSTALSSYARPPRGKLCHPRGPVVL